MGVVDDHERRADRTGHALHAPAWRQGTLQASDDVVDGDAEAGLDLRAEVDRDADREGEGAGDDGVFDVEATEQVRCLRTTTNRGCTRCCEGECEADSIRVNVDVFG